MKHTDAETVGAIIQRFLKAENLDGKLDEQRVSALWPDVVGQGINRYTMSRSVKDGVLYVRISSAPLRQELVLNRSILIKRLNEAVGREVIRDIVFR